MLMARGLDLTELYQVTVGISCYLKAWLCGISVDGVDAIRPCSWGYWYVEMWWLHRGSRRAWKSLHLVQGRASKECQGQARGIARVLGVWGPQQRQGVLDNTGY